MFFPGHSEEEGDAADSGSAVRLSQQLSSCAVIFTYHSCFCNRTKAVDENVAADVHWWACMTNTDWNSSSLCAHGTKDFHSVELNPAVGMECLRGELGSKAGVTQPGLVLVLMPV